MTDIRTKTGEAIIKAFADTYEKHGIDYDPDTCWYAADHVIAALVTELLDVDVEARHHSTLISHPRYVAKNADGEVMLPVSDNLL